MAKKRKPEKKKDQEKEIPFDEIVGTLLKVPPKRNSTSKTLKQKKR
jgi:hypothetical protein